MRILFLIVVMVCSSCEDKKLNESPEHIIPEANLVEKQPVIPPVKPITFSPATQQINTGTTTPGELVDFAKILLGTPYKYASSDPAAGFDCSGFLTYVFNHFNIAVPRSSVDFTNIEKTVALEDAKPGDLVLFTGTDSLSRLAGHIGIITSYENGEHHFIHSTSGKAMGVTITPLNKYYAFRFLKVIRIFPQNDL